MTAPPLREAFDAYKAETLSVVLGQAGVSAIPKTKEDKVSLWILLLADRKRIERSLGQLTPRCRKALELLQAAGGELRTVRFGSLLSRAGLLEPQSKQKKPAERWATTKPEEAADPATYQEVLAALVKHGLVWTHTNPGGTNAKLAFDAPGRFVIIPSAVAAHLPPPPRGTETVREVPHVLAGSARTCQRDLYLAWSTARETPFQTVATGQLRMSDLKRLSSQLLMQESIVKGSKESDYRRLFFLRRLAEKLAMLRWKNENGVYQLTAKADPAFLHVDPAQRVHDSFLAWRDGDWWNELWATYVQGDTRASGTLTDLAPPKVIEARQTVLNEIVRRAKGNATWIWLDTISLWLSTRNENFLVDRTIAESQRPMYYSYGPVTGSPYAFNALAWVWESCVRDEDLGWRTVEEVFIRSVVTEGLYWLGLVDLGYLQPVTSTGGAAPANVVAVRLTEMGRWLLLGEPKPALPEEAGRVVIQPNFRIFAFDPIADRVLARLDTFATRLNAERAIEYELSRDTIYRALLAGKNVDEIKAWLVDVSGNPIPQNVERSLDEWQAAFDRITIRRHVAVVQAASPELIDALLAVESVNRVILQRLGDTLVMVNAKKVDAIERALLAIDELPTRSGRAEEAVRGSIALGDDGAVNFAHGMPSLYVRGRLHAFADETGGAWRITAASARRAQESGMDAQAILSDLRELVAGPLPPTLETRIKAWSRHYGDAVVQSVTLIEFQDQATLDELLADPELKRYLKPFKPRSILGLALVDPENLDAVTSLLRERGVAVRG